MVLSPVVEKNREIYKGGRDLTKAYMEITDPETLISSLENRCLLCGSEARVILKWMKRDAFLELPHPRQKIVSVDDPEHENIKADGILYKSLDHINEDYIPDINFNDALEVLMTLREYLTDKGAFTALKRHYSMHELITWDQARQETLFRIFPRGSNFSRVLRHRLKGLWEEQNKLTRRARQWLATPDQSERRS